jgi:hypothetical protein
VPHCLQVNIRDESSWWQSLLQNPVLSIIDVHPLAEHSMVSVSGILGFMCTEDKLVRSETKKLLILKIIDRTGSIEVRSWTLTEADFSIHRERPILLKRLRVTAYAGIKMLELIDGGGSIIETNFPQAADLTAYWNEPAH